MLPAALLPKYQESMLMFAARSQGRCSLDLSFQLVALDIQKGIRHFHAAISKQNRTPKRV
jgi:hypothetical protein